MKACQRNWAEVFGDEGNMFAVSPSNSYQKVRLNATPLPVRGSRTQNKSVLMHP